MKISIIVPLYYGNKYLLNILGQITECRKILKESNIELILYNDCPYEIVYVNEEKYDFKIKVLNPGFNCGIHGARVHGLENATGEYVLFLDQDDKIVPTYLKKQLRCIGNADAVVCRAIHNNRLHYTNTHVFENVISKEFMLNKWCSIVSPGQVLIKKSSIPQLWKDNIMKNNGADDYLLWLLMFGEKRTFSLNQEVLFEHVVTGINVSNDTNKMMDSEMEMIQILKDNKVFKGEDEISLSNLMDSLRKIHIKELDNYKNAYVFLERWEREVVEGKSPFDFFEKHQIKKVAIYGAGDLGKSIELVLKNSDIEVCFFIDQNADYIISDVPVYRKEVMPKSVDAIIVSIKNRMINEELQRMVECPVYSSEDIFNIR